MTSNANENDRNLLDAAAKTFRNRVTSDSRFQAFIESAESPLAASILSADPSNSCASEFPKTGTPSDRWNVRLLCAERLSRSVDLNLAHIGDMPPPPPTIRGRVGAVLVRIVRRALFWYTSQIRVFHAMVADAAREQMMAFQEIGARQLQQQAQITRMLGQIAEAERHIRELRDSIASSVEAQAGRLGTLETSIEEQQRLREAQSTRIQSLEGLVEESQR
jgi:hypothetical protein